MSDAPNSLPPTLAEEEADGALEPQTPIDLGLRLQLVPFGLENLYDYGVGGHHPVHLHDFLGDENRYRVIHKLGKGGFANIWLCQDTKAQDSTKYVAVKVLVAFVSPDDCPELRVGKLQESLDEQEESVRASICLPLDQFRIKGPNGEHICFVYPALGPKISHGFFSGSVDPDKALRNMCFDVVKAVRFLHSQKMCHGDLTANNILHRVQGLDGLSEEEVLRILGEPRQNPIMKESTKGHDEPSAPQYLVYPVNWEHVAKEHITNAPCIIDFGESFDESNPPKELGIPLAYRSPELILENNIGIGVDLWALGCAIFEMRTGRKLFATFDNDDDCSLDAMVEVLGKLPEPWWSTTWEGRTIFYPDDADENDAAKAAPEPDPDVRVHPSVAEGARSIEDKLAPGVWYMSSDSPEDLHRDIPQEEIKILADLLRRFLRYDPKERLSAEAALEHDWFKM